MSESSPSSFTEELLHRFAAGDESAKTELIEWTHDRLRRIAHNHLLNFPVVRRTEESAGIVNASFPRLSKALDDVRPTTKKAFYGLAALQIRRVLLDVVRPGPRPDPIGLDDGDGYEDSNPSHSDKMEDLLNAIAQIPPDEQEVVDLLFIGGLTQVEAAEVLGVSVDTVKRRWTRARLALADLLAAYGAPAD